MKVTVVNLSSNTLSVPSPLNVTLTSGKSAVVVLKESEWKTVKGNLPISRLLNAKMLALAVLDDVTSVPAKAAPPAHAEKDEPVVEPEAAPTEPKAAPVAEPEPVSEPVAAPTEPEATPVAEPVVASEAAPEVEPEVAVKKKTKRKAKEKDKEKVKGW